MTNLSWPVIETKEMQYLYSDGDIYYFMDNETYEQVPLTQGIVEDAIVYMKENDTASVKFYQGNPSNWMPPTFVELKVTETEPGIKGIHRLQCHQIGHR
jgi:elongation factor P